MSVGVGECLDGLPVVALGDQRGLEFVAFADFGEVLEGSGRGDEHEWDLLGDVQNVIGIGGHG